MRWARIATVLLVVGLLLWAWRAGLFAELSHPQRLAQAIVALGARGMIGFVLAYAVLQPFGIPGTVFVVAAPLIWPWPIAFALSVVGTMSASVVGFSFARFVARDWVAARIPERFRRYDDALARHGFRTVFVLRLIFWMPQVLHGFLGVSKIPFWTHFWASLLGYLPPLFVVSYFTAEVFDAHGHLQPRALPIFGILVGGSLLTAFLVGRSTRKRSPG